MKMAKYIFIIGMVVFLSGCDYLDYDKTAGKNQEEAYSYFDNLNGLVSYMYTFLPSDFGNVNGALLESATDNSVFTWEDNNIYHICNGLWSPSNRIDDGWKYFDAIRAANSFLENYDPTALDRFEYNDNFDEISGKASKFVYEVRFLRAFYVFELAKRYGDIPLLTRTYDSEEINRVSMTPFDDVLAFVVKECDEIASSLPVNQEDFWGDVGRATRGTVMALKSRALLYGASPLHNAANDKGKWAEAAKAAYAIIEKGWYNLPLVTSDPLFDQLGGNTILNSSQLIFAKLDESKTNSFEAQNQPMGVEGAKGGNTPTQNLVDAYEMKNGEAFDWNNPEHVQNIYFNSSKKETRDPRLYINVIVNRSKWGKRIKIEEGGKHKILEGSTTTGYYLRKNVNPNVSLSPTKPNKIEHHYVIFRYAEILLNYAEAMNEWVGPDAAGEGCPMSAREALNIIRSSATMPAVEETGDDFTQKVRNERRVELAFEGHRFWDIRRWKIADSEDVKNIYGVKITKGEGFSYEKLRLQERYWNDKMYLYPFPEEELFINENLKQNKGWD
ncbi:RagB/SusD family nutrient uptake outer membrane protein [Puteibacter caeruleilacunae]|nr:RagB/SusD family nutrient uptake outer membrane protein [Puteibacter caeruleilacunae]